MIGLNNKSAKLLSILSGCKPDDEYLAKQSLMNSIVHSVEYQALLRRSSFIKACGSVLKAGALATYSVEELKNLKKAVPAIEDFLQNLMYSLKNGACPRLREEDRPSFFKRDELERLTKRLENGDGKNYTNIAPEDCMCIFEPDTVKELGDKFLELPANCDDYETAIANLMHGKKYCISQKEIIKAEEDYQAQVENYLEKAQSGKNRVFSFRLLRFAVMAMFVFIPWWIGRLYGNISSDWTIISMVGIIVVAIACWIWREK